MTMAALPSLLSFPRNMIFALLLVWTSQHSKVNQRGKAHHTPWRQPLVGSSFHSPCLPLSSAFRVMLPAERGLYFPSCLIMSRELGREVTVNWTEEKQKLPLDGSASYCSSKTRASSFFFFPSFFFFFSLLGSWPRIPATGILIIPDSSIL